MNLGRVRLRLTGLYTGLSAVAIVALAVVAVRTGTERVEEGADREAEQVVSALTLAGYQTGELEADNTWFVHVNGEEDSYDEPLGETWVEPPLYTVGEDALAYDSTHRRFDQDDIAYLAYGQRLNDTDAFVTVVELTYYQERAAALRLRIALAAGAAVLAVGVVGWFVSGRSLRPVREAHARQRDFVADAAHELRTPLAVIRASASQALSRPREPDAYRTSLEEIDVAAERAGAAVSELLEMARIDAGQLSPRLADLRLDLLVEEVVAGIRVDGCALAAEAAVPIVVDADYALLRQAIENVVRNAAARAAHVTVRARAEGRSALVEVVDDGPGFPEAVLPHVFERFRRGDERGSSGLGLAIVQSIVTSHGGSVVATNEAEGARVVVSLPLSRGRG